jgi:tryptophan synthase alpha chain
MLGDPDLAASAAILNALVEGGADMLEVGIPFSDPVADGPVIQAAAVRALAAGVAPVLIAAPNTPRATLAAIASEGEGYTYCVARAGVTGADEQVRFDERLLAVLAELGAPPPVLGFGISRPDHVRAVLAAGAAGIISGSAIVRLVAESPDPPGAVRAFAVEMKAATRGR